MEKEFAYLNALVAQKKQQELTDDDKNKLAQAESLLRIQGLFFKIDANTAIGLLDFLGVPKENMKELYSKLTSPEAFVASNQQEYYVVEPESFTK